MLCPISSLSPEDSQYDYSMAYETLATLLVLDYNITPVEEGHTELKYQELEEGKYRQSNGYLPRPLDLDSMRLEDGLHGLVERLAENCHNVWAAGRIKQGWTYGRSTVSLGVHVYTCCCVYIHVVVCTYMLLCVVVCTYMLLCTYMLCVVVCTYMLLCVHTCCVYIHVHVHVVCTYMLSCVQCACIMYTHSTLSQKPLLYVFSNEVCVYLLCNSTLHLLHIAIGQ